MFKPGSSQNKRFQEVRMGAVLSKQESWNTCNALQYITIQNIHTLQHTTIYTIDYNT